MADPNNIILPEYKIAGFLLAKVANTSIKTAFLRGLGVTQSLAYGVPGVAKLINGGTVFQYADTETIAGLGSDWYKFSIVRNPWARAASIWMNKVYSPPSGEIGIGFRSVSFVQGWLFLDFVKRLGEMRIDGEIHWREPVYSHT